MKFVVHGVRTCIISTVVEAEDYEDALVEAGRVSSLRDIDTWDSEFIWQVATPEY